MKFEEPHERVSPPKEGIIFDSVELCALDSAFENPKNADTIDILRYEFPETYTESRTKFFSGASMMRLDIEKFRNFLTAMKGVADKEKAQLALKPDLSLLSCGHRVAEHILALKSVDKKIKE